MIYCRLAAKKATDPRLQNHSTWKTIHMQQTDDQIVPGTVNSEVTVTLPGGQDIVTVSTP